MKFPAVKLVFLVALLASFVLVGCPAETTPTPGAPVNDLTPTPSADDLTTYMVAEGDTLASIAARYSITVEAILEVNPDIDDPAVIVPGQAIFLPQEAEEPTRYTVEEGDTVESIVIDHDVTVEAIMMANPDIADPDDIQPGQEIWIPASVPLAEVTPTPDVDVTPTPDVDVTPTPDVDVTPTPDVDVTPTPDVDVTPTPDVDETPTPPPGDLAVYTVEGVDTLDSIAARFSITTEALLEVNPDLDDLAAITPDQEIYLPPEAQEPTLYTVQEGDTLEDIALEHDVTVEAITAANPDITLPIVIVPGQEIWIPAAVPEPPADETRTPTPDVDVTPTPDGTLTPDADVTPTPDADVTPTPTIAPEVAMTIEIVAQDFEFDPDTIEVPVGQRVEFIVSTADNFYTFSVRENEDATDDIIHVQLCPPNLCPGAEPVRFQHVFTEPGEYYLYCSIHEDEGMVGTIIVQ
jgi:LysM repeat protein